jgi:hypothetical protein
MKAARRVEGIEYYNGPTIRRSLIFFLPLEAKDDGRRPTTVILSTINPPKNTGRVLNFFPRSLQNIPTPLGKTNKRQLIVIIRRRGKRIHSATRSSSSTTTTTTTAAAATTTPDKIVTNITVVISFVVVVVKLLSSKVNKSQTDKTDIIAGIKSTSCFGIIRVMIF